jgi:hypothetical protein
LQFYIEKGGFHGGAAFFRLKNDRREWPRETEFFEK